MSVIDLFAKIEEVFTGAEQGRGEPQAEPRPKVSELETLLCDYNDILQAYSRYIEVMEQPDDVREACFHLMGVSSFEEAVDNVKVLTVSLSILWRKIQKCGYRATPQEALHGFDMVKERKRGYVVCCK